jgi:hypothetical protein
MKKIPLISASFLLGSIIITSCSTNKMATVSTDDNLYFMASDVELATKFAVDNNNPKSFENISQEPALVEENFSSRNVNPEYISRYQATENASDDGVVYFDEQENQQANSGNVNAYDNYAVGQNQNGFNNSPNINFNFGLGYGFGGMMMSPWGFYDPFFSPAWGFRPGLSIGLGMGFGWRRPFMGMGGFGFYDPFMMGGFGWGNPYMMGLGGFGWGNPYFGFGQPIYAGRPIFVLPGGEYGDRRIVSGARPTRGSSLTNSGFQSGQAGVLPSTSRAQARGNAAAVNNTSARRLVSSENSRVSTRDFSNSQNDYYNSSRTRTATTRNISSPASDRGSATTQSRTSIPSARRPNVYSPNNSMRNYSPGRSTTPTYNGRMANPSYNNRTTSPSYNRTPTMRSSPSYNRGVNPSNNRVTVPSRSNAPTFSAPSRSGGSMSAPSRSSGGSSGGSVGGSRGGRGN